MGAILYIVATLLYIPLTILNLIIVGFKYRGNINRYLWEEAFEIDMFANRSFRTLWNLTLRTKEGYEFGREGETISSAMGKNKRDGTLSKIGWVLDFILDLFDNNHSIKSINDKL